MERHAMFKLHLALAIAIFASPAFAKGGIGALFGGLVGAAAGQAAGKALASPSSIEAALVKMTAQVNPRLPMKVDTVTTWETVSPGPGKSFAYHYTIHRRAADIDVAEFRTAMDAHLKKTICASSDMHVFFKYGVTVRYSYQDQLGAFLGQVSITPRDCGFTA
jgi:hypothetical protein